MNNFRNRQAYNAIKELQVNNQLKSYLEGIGGFEVKKVQYPIGDKLKLNYLDTIRVKCDKSDESFIVRMVEKISTFEHIETEDLDNDRVLVVFNENESNTFERFILNELGIDSSKFENGEVLSKMVNALTT